jgi:formate-dependent nitrite reductase membrane component NrfD
VLKLRSPMSVGTWVLVAFGPLAALLGARQAAEDGVLPGRLRSAAYWLGNGRIETPAGVLGIALAGYTGVLLGATAVPLWTRRATLLGPLFLCSAMSSAAAAVALVRSRIGTGHDPRLAAFEQGASLAESAALLAWMAALGKTGAPLRDGRRGSALRHGVGGIGLALPLLLNAAGQATSRRRPLATGAALLTLLGGFLLRYLVVVGGHASADDPEATFEITRRRTADPS